MTVRPDSVLEQALQRKGQLIQWRRTVHANPELSFREFETAELVASTLKAIPGMNVTEGVAKTGVVGTLHGAPGPLWLFERIWMLCRFKKRHITTTVPAVTG
ncbi:hypothetical protein [Novibacillus thermophilus]|uniref:hypothetical protein n=1 Tax=Novibacillus thermophilus TaxID=1471761 RepID=UPI0026AF3CE3